MRRILPILALTAWSCIVLAQQPAGNPSGQTPPPSASSSTPDGSSVPDSASASKAQDTTSDQASPGTQASDQQQDQQKPTRAQRAKKHVKEHLSEWCVSPLNKCYEKKPKDDDQKQPQAKNTPSAPDQNRPPRSDDATTSATPADDSTGESSSIDTKIDLRPPEGDAAAHADSEAPDTGDATEFHQWDPHRAMKNVEVGDYYYSQKNYRAAVSRYQEALQWKANDATALFKLGDAEDKLGNKDDARKNYTAYLKVLPNGPKAEDAKKALDRLK
jgi:tetratricopeptide (TPR) repeat protein